MRDVASARKDFQCWAFVALIDLKYPCLESLAIALSGGSSEAQAFREDEWNSFRRVDSSGDHHSLPLIDGRQDGVWDLRSSISVPRWESNHSSKACLVGRAGGGGELGFRKLLFKVRPVCPDPVRGRRRPAGDWVRQPYRDRDMVRPSGGEVSCPFLEERHQGRGRECEV